MKTKVPFSRAYDIVLTECYRMSSREDKTNFILPHFCERFEGRIPVNFVVRALRKLEGEGRIKRLSEIYAIEDSLLLEVEERLDNSDYFTENFLSLGFEFLDQHLNSHGTEKDILAPDHIGELDISVVREIVRRLRELERVVEQTDFESNSIKEQISANVRMAKAMASSPSPKWSAVRALLEPLSNLASIGSLVVGIIALIVVVN